MITGDLDRALGTEPSSAGTWRPGPPGAGLSGTYATSVAFLLAGETDVGAGRPAADPERVAGSLARRLAGVNWVRETAVTGGGYLTVTVTDEALVALTVRITKAGPDCARGDALDGVTVTAPASPALAGARTWEQARCRLSAHLTGRLAAAAGATVLWSDDHERPAGPGEGADAGHSPVADAIAYAGLDLITLALSRVPPGGRVVIDAAAAAARRPPNPAYAVRYAHAHAASTLRQAADLGLDRGDAEGFVPLLLAHPSERALLYELSWLPERVAGAARRERPDVFARYLEDLAQAYLDCQQSCPAVWPGMAVPGATGPVGPAAGRPGCSPGGAAVTARLWLASAARTALAAGLSLLGAGAPDRL